MTSASLLSRSHRGLSELKVDAVMFDIDGTLVDTRESYDKAIVETANLILLSLTGASLPEREALKAVYRLRMTGLYNLDWDTAYVVVMSALAGLSEDALAEIAEKATLESFSLPGSSPTRADSTTMLRSLQSSLKLAAGGVAQFTRKLLSKCSSRRLKLLAKVREYLGYPERSAGSLLASIFDEIYYGSSRYLKLAGRLVVGDRPGLIEREKLIVEERTLRWLSKVTRERLGIVSGRSRASADEVLGSLMSYFNPKATVFVEDLARVGVRASKPDPRILEESLAALEPFAAAAYVGGSPEDAEMALRAGVYFIGVYSTHPAPGKLASKLLELRAAVIPTVNELPMVIA